MIFSSVSYDLLQWKLFLSQVSLVSGFREYYQRLLHLHISHHLAPVQSDMYSGQLESSAWSWSVLGWGWQDVCSFLRLQLPSLVCYDLQGRVARGLMDHVDMEGHSLRYWIGYRRAFADHWPSHIVSCQFSRGSQESATPSILCKCC